ncbi:type VI secretion system Vgr family protein [Alcaligenes sp. SDU_A2]|uniref:type VI secretion system Vgr family protein n=1 Tax=Alcaligenes sp. SDU_A2 TaxID=3136634 RepID=UPI00311DCA93
MLNDYDTEQALASFRCGLADPDLFLVTRWSGEEAVSRPYRFEIELASARDDINLEELLGARATLSVLDAQERWLPWHGIITELRQTHRDDGFAHYRAVLEPQMALLRMFRLSRVYVQADAQAGGKPDLGTVIRMVLAQCGLNKQGEPAQDSGAQYCMRLSADLLAATRTGFICQFEESSLDFLSRRLEHEGVYYWFEHGVDHEILVFGHERPQQPRQAVPLYWRPAGALSGEQSRVGVSRFDHALSVSPRAVVLRDFSVSQPSLNLTMKAAIDPQGQPPQDRFDGVGSVEIYGAHYSKQDDGERMATLRAEEIACQRSRFQGVALAPGVRAGYPVQLHEHFRADFNQRYFVIALRHEGRQPLPRQGGAAVQEQAFYQASLTVLPESRQFRPARLTPKPRVVGFLSAIVVAEGQGEYAQINEHGCYRIRFLFAPIDANRPDGGNSAWVRMATPYAGSQHGMNFPLLKGTEVLVSFLGGDPDRPVIVSAIPNEENPSIRNQDNATQPGLRTAGQNALEFEDRQGAQHTRLSSPTLDSTFQLGADPASPHRSGVRLSTKGHMGLLGRSFIQQVPGIYHLEVGNKGNVDTDPEPRERLKQAQDQAMADFLEEQACLPTATAPVQMKALAARRALLAQELAKLQARAQGAAGGQAGMDGLLKQLQALLAKLDNALEKLAKGQAVSDDPEKEGDGSDEDKKDGDKAEKKKKKTSSEKFKELMDDVNSSAKKVKEGTDGWVEASYVKLPEKVLDISLLNVSPIKISTSLGAEMSASASLKSSIVVGYSVGIKYSGSKELDLRDYTKVELSDQSRITKGDEKKIILGAEKRVVRSQQNKVVDMTGTYGKQSITVANAYTLTSRTIKYIVGTGGMETQVAGKATVQGAPTSLLSWEVLMSKIKISKAQVVIKAGNAGVILESMSTTGQLKVKDTVVYMKAPMIDVAGTNVRINGSASVNIKANGIVKLN